MPGDHPGREVRHEGQRQPERQQPGQPPALGHPKAEESPVGKVVMYSSVSVDGFVADENDQPGPLFDRLSSGNVPLDEPRAAS